MSLYDSCVYVRKLDRIDTVYLLLYVDDILIANTSKGEIEHVKKALGTEFEMKDLGVTKRILGMDFKRNRSMETLFLSQATLLAENFTEVLHASVQTFVNSSRCSLQVIKTGISSN